MNRLVRGWALTAFTSLAVIVSATTIWQDHVRAAETDCGGEKACVISGGKYFIRMPQGWDGKSKVGAALVEAVKAPDF